eukprot:1864549-Amphidinium_carterae.1
MSCLTSTQTSRERSERGSTENMPLTQEHTRVETQYKETQKVADHWHEQFQHASSCAQELQQEVQDSANEDVAQDLFTEREAYRTSEATTRQLRE